MLIVIELTTSSLWIGGVTHIWHLFRYRIRQFGAVLQIPKEGFSVDSPLRQLGSLVVERVVYYDTGSKDVFEAMSDDFDIVVK